MALKFECFGDFIEIITQLDKAEGWKQPNGRAVDRGQSRVLKKPLAGGLLQIAASHFLLSEQTNKTELLFSLDSPKQPFIGDFLFHFGHLIIHFPC